MLADCGVEILGSDGLFLFGEVELHNRVGNEVLLELVKDLFFVAGTVGRDLRELVLEISSSSSSSSKFSSTFSLLHLLSDSFLSIGLCSGMPFSMFMQILCNSSCLFVRILLALCSGDCLMAICCSILNCFLAQIPSFLSSWTWSSFNLCSFCFSSLTFNLIALKELQYPVEI